MQIDRYLHMRITNLDQLVIALEMKKDIQGWAVDHNKDSNESINSYANKILISIYIYM